MEALAERRAPSALWQERIDEAAARLDEVLRLRPEGDRSFAEECMLRGEPRPWPALYLWRDPDVEAGECRQAPPPPISKCPEERVLRLLGEAAAPFEKLNPVSRSLRLGRGTGTLAASFGVSLESSIGDTPFGQRPLEEVIAEGLPDPETSGLMPELKETIEAIQELTPPWVKIRFPDMQGPFNIAHMILGDEVFLAPLTDPERFDALMELITEFYLAAHRKLLSWIEPERLARSPEHWQRIAECSVNMISADTYCEHVLKHDRKIAEAFGRIAIHPCSGPHVFKATWEKLPNVVYTEAGIMLKRMFAGSISVEEALRQIGGKPVALGIGQELPADFAEAERIVKGFLDLSKDNPRISYSFTGIYWRKADEPAFFALHRRLDEYWHEHVWRGGKAVKTQSR